MYGPTVKVVQRKGERKSRLVLTHSTRVAHGGCLGTHGNARVQIRQRAQQPLQSPTAPRRTPAGAVSPPSEEGAEARGEDAFLDAQHCEHGVVRDVPSRTSAG